jgi:ribonuclease R
MGDKVTIKVISANLGKRQLDYEWVIAVGLSDPAEDGKKVVPFKEKIKFKKKKGR